MTAGAGTVSKSLSSQSELKASSDSSAVVNNCTTETGTDAEEDLFRCPPGSYLNNTDAEVLAKKARLQSLQNTLGLMGYLSNSREEYKAEYTTRGYATYESPVWLKPEECQTLPDEEWTAENNEWYYQYQPDHAPTYITKQRYTDYEFEFHDNWKVASTSFSSYFPCEYGDHETVNEAEGIPEGYKVVAATRYPMSRFVSAVGELLERSMNHYCPSGYCQTKDSFDNETLWKLQHQTTWYPLMCNETKLVYNETGLRWETVPKCHFDYEKFPEILTAFVHDKKCNYYFYASEHFVSQSAFVTQNDGCAHDIDTIIRLEELDEGLDEVAAKLGKTMSCTMGDSNSASNKPGGLPSESMTYELLEKIPTLMKDLCMIYAQDFICFDYDLPAECEGLF